MHADEQKQIVVENDTLYLYGRLEFDTVKSFYEKSIILLASIEQPTVDLRHITASNSAGIGLLIGLMRRLKKDKKAVNFCNLPGQLKEIAKLSNLTDILPIN